ncbi:ribonuclease H family protein [Methanobrevibacter sp.]
MIIMTDYTYYTDGAATMVNRNGKYLRQAGGWAFIRLDDGKETSSQSGGCPLTTNNEMELYAIYASIRDYLDNADGNDSLVICSDSSYCINIFESWAYNWQKNGWRKGDGKPIQNLELIKAIWNLMGQIDDVSFRKVKGHSKNRLNNKVDKLAVVAKKVAKTTGKTLGYNGEPDNLLGQKQN